MCYCILFFEILIISFVNGCCEDKKELKYLCTRSLCCFKLLSCIYRDSCLQNLINCLIPWLTCSSITQMEGTLQKFIPSELEHDLHFLTTESEKWITRAVLSPKQHLSCITTCVPPSFGQTVGISHLSEGLCSASEICLVSLLSPEHLSKFPLGKLISKLAGPWSLYNQGKKWTFLALIHLSPEKVFERGQTNFCLYLSSGKHKFLSIDYKGK